MYTTCSIIDGIGQKGISTGSVYDNATTTHISEGAYKNVPASKH